LGHSATPSLGRHAGGSYLADNRDSRPFAEVDRLSDPDPLRKRPQSAVTSVTTVTSARKPLAQAVSSMTITVTVG